MIIVGMDVHVRNSFLHVTDGDGHLLRRGLLHGLKDLFSASGRQWLAELTLDDAGRVYFRLGSLPPSVRRLAAKKMGWTGTGLSWIRNLDASVIPRNR